MWGLQTGVCHDLRSTDVAAVVKFPIENLVCMPAQAKNVILSGVFALLLGSVLSAYLVLSSRLESSLTSHIASSCYVHHDVSRIPEAPRLEQHSLDDILP